MGNDEVIIAIGLLFTLLVLIIIKIIGFCMRFHNDTCYIIMEMRRAREDNEYRYWRRELRCHYLCLLPFVTERNVMRLYKKIYHKSKQREKEKRSDGIYHILASSVTGICICMICLCGGSWAWFSGSQSTGVTKIQTATYTAEVTVTKAGTTIDTIKEHGIYTVSLESGGQYQITILAKGTAENGYCKVKLGEETFYTPQIKKGKQFVFQVTAYEGGRCILTPQWGTCASLDTRIDSDTPLLLGQEPKTFHKQSQTISEQEGQNPIAAEPSKRQEERNTITQEKIPSSKQPEEQKETPSENEQEDEQREDSVDTGAVPDEEQEENPTSVPE